MNVKLPAPVAAWYAGLAVRERRLVAVGAAMVVSLIVYLAVVQPLTAAHNRLDRKLEADRSLLVYMNRAASRLKAAAPAGPAGNTSVSVFSAVSTAAQVASIKNAVQRLEQADNGGVRLTLSSVSFDALVPWLENLANQEGIAVESANIQRAQAPGAVNATLTLNRHS